MTINEIGQKASMAKSSLIQLSSEEKNKILLKIADNLVNKNQYILKENKKDVAIGQGNHMSEGLLDRLTLTSQRVQDMAEGLKKIALLGDPIGEIIEQFIPNNGLEIKKVRVPLGVIGIIYEARPNVTCDAFGLCFKTSNVVVLKGGKDAIYSNSAITNIIQEVLERTGVSKDCIQLIMDTRREITAEFMKCNQYIDVLIPRGGAGLIQTVIENSTIPVIETGTGNCHIYIDKSANLDRALKIIINAKTQRIGVCNACESLVIHEAVAEQFLPVLASALLEQKVEIRGDERVCQYIKNSILATQEDYGREFLDYIISIKVVDSIEEGIVHINAYNTKHSEAIITEDEESVEKFLKEIDAACVYVNASTRFTDGYEFGFGAEIGISTQKLHARGPMGLKELTSYKYEIIGSGQIRK